MTQIVKLNPEEYGLQAKEAATIEKAFKPMIEKMVELETEFNQVVKLAEKGITKESVQAAKELRLKYVKTRTGTAEIHKTAKAYYLAGGRFVDGWKNAQLFASQGKEQELEKIEKHFENIEAERIQKIREERNSKLAAVGYMENVPGIEMMEQGVFEAFLKGAEQQIKLREQAEKEEAEARMKKEQEETLFQTRKNHLFRFGGIVPQDFDFESLRTMPEENFKAFLAGLRDEQEKQEAERKRVFEEQEKARLEAQEVAKNERKERERIAAELEAKNKAEQDAANLKREAEQRAAGATDEERFKALLSDLFNAAARQDQKFTTEKGVVLFGKVVKLLAKIETFVNEEIKK